jgi:tetratricopeptide (TPR) repeat protein
MTRKNTVITRTGIAIHVVFRMVVLFALTFLVSSCATLGGNVNAVNQVNKKDCLSRSDGKDNCGSTGVIVISENYDVDTGIRKEFQSAVELLNEEKYPDAIKLLKDITDKSSKFTAPYINLGIAYARTGDMENAEENLKKALAINNRHPVALNELGLVYRKTGQYQRAREEYESVLDVYPDFLPARKNLGVLCDIYIQDLNCALKQYEEYLKRVPEDPKIKIWIADVKNRMK